MTSRTPITVPDVARRKRSSGSAPFTMVTAYDEPSARLADAAGVDLLLVGDSVGNTVLGRPDTLSVTVEEMAHHTRAVAAASPSALIVADMPWMSYHLDPMDAVRNAATLIRAGAGCVKLEGGANRAAAIAAITAAEIPVMGHLGLTPQSLLAMGGFKVQGKTKDAAAKLLADAEAIQDAGCFAVVLEGIPDVVANTITEALAIPTIGIGAGAGTDGQVLVFHDLLGLGNRTPAKFVRTYADIGTQITGAISAFVADVASGAFPSDAETYHAPKSFND
jgi:3-methyl-2-oxobutanoate hydroxymethyltransferase